MFLWTSLYIIRKMDWYTNMQKIDSECKCNQCQFHKLNGYLAEIISCETIKCVKFSNLKKLWEGSGIQNCRLMLRSFNPGHLCFLMSYFICFSFSHLAFKNAHDGENIRNTLNLNTKYLLVYSSILLCNEDPNTC